MKQIKVRSAVPIYLAAVVWLLIGLIAPKWLLSLGTLAVTAILSAAVYVAGSFVFKGKTVEVREKADSGDANVNKQIEDGRRTLDQIAEANRNLPDPIITAQLDRMEKAGNAIFDVLEKHPERAFDVRRFMNYYLPTAQKILAEYVVLAQSPTGGENMAKAKQSVENSLGMIASAFEKQLDSLYQDKTYELDAEIFVFETVMKTDGMTTDNNAAGMQAGR